MKRTLALSFALSILTATSAFASQQAVVSTAQPAVTSATQIAERLDTTTPDVRVAAAGNKTFDRANLELNSKVLVAENRKEFGSQYQRY
jgi:hypothetical protein